MRIIEQIVESKHAYVKASGEIPNEIHMTLDLYQDLRSEMSALCRKQMDFDSVCGLKIIISDYDPR